MSAKKKPPAPAPTERLTVEMWPITRPIPYAKNARKLSERAIETLASSLKEFGWRQPIVCDAKDVIVAGHTRLMAAQALGMTEVPVHVARGLTPRQVRAYRIMDNRSADETTWDLALLPEELAELQAMGMDLALTGFDIGELDNLMRPPPPEDEDTAPIACEKLGRCARLMELDPAYADVIVERWQIYTGKIATLDGDGRTFAEVKAARAGKKNAA